MLTRYVVFICAFLLGFAIMALEMLGSRYLNPYFGSGLDTWAALISTVLLAMTVGYFAGGHLADRWPNPAIPGLASVLAAAYLLIEPSLTGWLFGWIASALSNSPVIAVLCASTLLLLLPMTAISIFFPFAVRLLLHDAQHGGRVSGHINAISALGNILGTLLTAFVLFPLAGSRTLTTCVALLVGVCGLILVAQNTRGVGRA